MIMFIIFSLLSSEIYGNVYRVECEYVVDYINHEKYLEIDGHRYEIVGMDHKDNCPCDDPETIPEEYLDLINH